VGINTNVNDPKNVIATVGGLASDGTSWLMDLFVTIVLVAVIMGGLDWLMPDALQASAPVITNTLIVVPGSISAVYIWRRAQADNERRRAAKRAGK
jgi:hypothetical protein